MCLSQTQSATVQNKTIRHEDTNKYRKSKIYNKIIQLQIESLTKKMCLKKFLKTIQRVSVTNSCR